MGQWKNDLQDGYGIEVWEDGSKYEGFFKAGIKTGQGRYFWADNNSYTGTWRNNKINGYVMKDCKFVGFLYMGRWKAIYW